MEVEVEARGRHEVKEDGQRLLLFEVVEVLLLYLARQAKLGKTRVILAHQEGQYRVQLEPEGEVNFEAAQIEGSAGETASKADLLEHIRERLYQVEGNLQIEPDPRRANRVIITSAIEAV